jgi:hypothetical protein
MVSRASQAKPERSGCVDQRSFIDMPATVADQQAFARGDASSRIFTIHGGDQGELARHVPILSRIPVVTPVLPRRFFTADGTRAFIAVLHRFGPVGELEFVVANHRLPLTRGVIRKSRAVDFS